MWLDVRLTLASGSATRLAMLSAAGLDVTVSAPPPHVEVCAKAGYAGPAEDLPKALATAKAAAVAANNNGFVLGADQILLHYGRVFEKPRDRHEAAGALAMLSGTSHQLISALSLWFGGREIWSYSDHAVLAIRPLSAADIEAYLDRVGDSAFASVGAYQVEGQGIQLFDKIDGDHFTILGLPLLPLLTFLRHHASGTRP